MSQRTDYEQWVPVDVHHETGHESILSEVMKRLTQTPIWNKQTKNNRRKGRGKTDGGAGEVGEEEKYEDSLHKQVCFVLLWVFWASFLTR